MPSQSALFIVSPKREEYRTHLGDQLYAPDILKDRVCLSAPRSKTDENPLDGYTSVLMDPLLSAEDFNSLEDVASFRAIIDTTSAEFPIESDLILKNAPEVEKYIRSWFVASSGSLIAGELSRNSFTSTSDSKSDIADDELASRLFSLQFSSLSINAAKTATDIAISHLSTFLPGKIDGG
ncbi:hypothetical protein [Yoonia sp. BS5-3]|uniref:Uncharacterized protein n=1 Tax=Yoonia phaeophyticola TaxID=3137369 RepID=A0ABZ2UZS0_9RHOB